MEAIIYATPMDYEGNDGQRMPYFYLHGIAEDRTGYDCCNGNIEAFSYALMEGIFLADIIFPDGSKERCLVSSKPKMGRMSGYIALLNDADAIEYAVNIFNKHKPSMYDHFKNELNQHYPQVQQQLKNLFA